MLSEEEIRAEIERLDSTPMRGFSRSGAGSKQARIEALRWVLGEAEHHIPDIESKELREVKRDYHGAEIGPDGMVDGPGGQRLKPAEDPWPEINARRAAEGTA